MKRIIKLVFYLAGAISFVVFMTNLWIVLSTEQRVFKDLDQVPDMHVGLVLGTSHRLRSGESNKFFEQRIEQTVRLFKGGKIRYVLVSGDNSTKYYNEPVKMKQALIDKGIPDSVVFMDFAGFRTLDSIVRCKEIFGQDEVIIISQDFHSYRALFIADNKNLRAVASVGEKLPFFYSIKIEMREILARTVAFWDIYIAGTVPRFLGEKEFIP